MNFILEICYTDRDPIIFRGVKQANPDPKNGFLTVMFHDHGTLTKIPIGQNCLYYSKFNEKEYDKEKTNSDMPKRSTHREGNAK